MTTSAKDRVEQRIALGDTPVEIAVREGLPLKTVERIFRAIDNAHKALEVTPKNKPKRDLSKECRNGHERRPENTGRNAKGVFCRDCKRELDRASRRRRIAIRAEVDAAMRRHPAGKAL